MVLVVKSRLAVYACGAAWAKVVVALGGFRMCLALGGLICLPVRFLVVVACGWVEDVVFNNRLLIFSEKFVLMISRNRRDII